MPLTELAIRKAKANTKAYKLTDGDGLFLLVKPNGGKYWRFKYRFGNKEKLMAFGTYPEVPFSEVREKRQDARKLLRDGIDPGAKKQEDKRLAVFNSENTFKSVTLEWHEANKAKWTQMHGEKILRRLELHIFPDLGNRPIKEIKPVELLDAIRKVEKRKATHLAYRFGWRVMLSNV